MWRGTRQADTAGTAPKPQVTNEVEANVDEEKLAKYLLSCNINFVTGAVTGRMLSILMKSLARKSKQIDKHHRFKQEGRSEDGELYFIYVDESGDTGIEKSPTNWFALSGLVLHELRWLETLNALIDFRRFLKEKYGLKLREEIHSTEFIHRPGELARIPKYQRLLILGDVLNFEARLPGVSVLNVIVDKRNRPEGYAVFENAWTMLLQRFHNTIDNRNFPGPQNAEDKGLVLTDRTMASKLQKLLRQKRRHNPVPFKRPMSGYKDIPLVSIVEDPINRDSRDSYFIQLADVNAYFLYQRYQPNKYVLAQGARNYFVRLDPVLCKVASRSDPHGVVIG